MSDPNELTKLLAIWRDHYIAICQDGVDPGEAAEAMFQFAALMLEKIRGSELASMTLLAGSDFMKHRAMPPARTEPTDDGAARH
jgi:hypothetical protein